MFKKIVYFQNCPQMVEMGVDFPILLPAKSASLSLNRKNSESTFSPSHRERLHERRECSTVAMGQQ